MKKLLLSLWVLMTSLTTMAQGWPSQYEGVMLQGFYWDSYKESKWTVLESQADELSQYFKLVWIQYQLQQFIRNRDRASFHD